MSVQARDTSTLPPNIDTMPMDVLRTVAVKMDPWDLYNFCKTSRRMQSICSNQTFWKSRIVNEFPQINLTGIPESDYQGLYLYLAGVRIYEEAMNNKNRIDWYAAPFYEQLQKNQIPRMQAIYDKYRLRGKLQTSNPRLKGDIARMNDKFAQEKDDMRYRIERDLDIRMGNAKLLMYNRLRTRPPRYYEFMVSPQNIDLISDYIHPGIEGAPYPQLLHYLNRIGIGTMHDFREGDVIGLRARGNIYDPALPDRFVHIFYQGVGPRIGGLHRFGSLRVEEGILPPYVLMSRARNYHDLVREYNLPFAFDTALATIDALEAEDDAFEVEENAPGVEEEPLEVEDANPFEEDAAGEAEYFGDEAEEEYV